MEEMKLFAGEDLALAGNVNFEDGDTVSSVREFDVRIELSTTPLGTNLTGSTSGDGSFTVHYRDDNHFIANISGDQTLQLTPGLLTVGLLFVHRETSLRFIEEFKTFRICESRISKYL